MALGFHYYRRRLARLRLGRLAALTAVAGVVMNYVTAFLFCPVFYLVLYYVNIPIVGLQYFLEMFTLYLFLYSVSFCVFNLIPLGPLDGGKILAWNKVVWIAMFAIAIIEVACVYMAFDISYYPFANPFV